MSAHVARDVPLYNRDGAIVAFTTVDDADYAATAAHRWHRDARGYARRYEMAPDGRKIVVLVHRVLLGLEPGDGLEADHINRDRLDNRRANLRVATRAENVLNRGPHRGSTSRYRGVWWEADKAKWRARGRLNGVRTSLGVFDDELAAATAAARWRAANLPGTPEPHPELLEAA